MHREQSSGKRIGSRRGRQKASGVGSSKGRRALLAQTVDLKEERREEKEVGDSLFLALYCHLLGKRVSLPGLL